MSSVFKPVQISEFRAGSGFMVKVFALVGLVIAVGLTILDFVTSVMGIGQIMGKGNGGWIVTLMPWLFGGLAVTFNGLSAHIFRHYREAGFGAFARSLTFVMWGCFMVYDSLSSFIGILGTYTGIEINSMEAWGRCVGQDRRAFRDDVDLHGSVVVMRAVSLLRVQRPCLEGRRLRWRVREPITDALHRKENHDRTQDLGRRLRR